MTRATVRFATAGALSALLLSTLGGLTAERSSGTSPSPAKVGPGQQVSVTAYHSNVGALDAGGDRVAFSSTSTLTPDDTATGSDVYIWHPGV